VFERDNGPMERSVPRRLAKRIRISVSSVQAMECNGNRIRNLKNESFWSPSRGTLVLESVRALLLEVSFEA
jgi:hypothetical protein